MKIFTVHTIITIIAAIYIAIYAELPIASGIEFLLYISIYLFLWMTSFIYSRRYFYAIWFSIYLTIYFIKELFISNLEMIFHILSPKLKLKPAIIAYPLKAKTDLEIAMLANMITLTPGTLTLDISEDKTILFYHTINVKKDIDTENNKIANGFERLLLKITR